MLLSLMGVNTNSLIAEDTGYADGNPTEICYKDRFHSAHKY